MRVRVPSPPPFLSYRDPGRASNGTLAFGPYSTHRGGSNGNRSRPVVRSAKADTRVYL